MYGHTTTVIHYNEYTLAPPAPGYATRLIYPHGMHIPITLCNIRLPPFRFLDALKHIILRVYTTYQVHVIRSCLYSVASCFFVDLFLFDSVLILLYRGWFRCLAGLLACVNREACSSGRLDFLGRVSPPVPPRFTLSGENAEMKRMLR